MGGESVHQQRGTALWKGKGIEWGLVPLDSCLVGNTGGKWMPAKPSSK